MTTQLLVDTDILIDVSREIQEAIDCLSQIEQQGSIAISCITQMELIIGCRNKKELETLDDFLAEFEIISVDTAISDTAVKLLQEYRLSHGLLIADALIAATAISGNASLISKNQRDYRFIKELTLLPYPNPFV